jgi:hypothetical protein
MGIRSKKRNAEGRKAKKRAAKAAKRALYASYAGTGRKRNNQGRASGPTALKGCHAMRDCGNVGCLGCYPQFRAASHRELAARAGGAGRA